jgi:hypothetical protein
LIIFGVALGPVWASLSEIAFLIRVFFFVFLLIYDVSGPLFYSGIFFRLALTVANVILRYVAVFAATLHGVMRTDRGKMTLICGQGLAHATLSVIPLQFGLPKAELYLITVANLILMTNVLTSLSALLTGRSTEKLVSVRPLDGAKKII